MGRSSTELKISKHTKTAKIISMCYENAFKVDGSYQKVDLAFKNVHGSFSRKFDYCHRRGLVAN